MYSENAMAYIALKKRGYTNKYFFLFSHKKCSPRNHMLWLLIGSAYVSNHSIYFCEALPTTVHNVCFLYCCLFCFFSGRHMKETNVFGWKNVIRLWPMNIYSHYVGALTLWDNVKVLVFRNTIKVITVIIADTRNGPELLYIT